MVCGESNEMNGEKIILYSTTEKNCLLLIRPGKKCTFKLGIKKKV